MGARQLFVTSDGAAADSTGADSMVDSGGGCRPTVTADAIATSGNYTSVIGQGGYVYAFDDGSGSKSCIAATALCGAGSPPPRAKVYGALTLPST